MERQALLFPQPPGDPTLPAYAVNDVSGLGAFNFGQMDKPQGVVIHHTGGGGTPEGIMNVFRQRGLATQYIMDREGNIHQALPDGMRGQHIRPSQINGLTNANTLGIEIIAKDDSDVTEKQRDAAARWLTETQAKYGIPAANVFGHGEINNHKQATEGSTVVNNWRAANRIAAPDLGPPAAGGDLPMEQRTLMAYAGRDARPRPQPSPSSQFDQAFEEASKETGIPVAILKAQAQQESRFNPNAIGRSGEVGLLQVKPSTAAQPGYGVEPVDPSKLTDPAENIRFGARYLAARARAAGVESWNDPQQVAKGLTAYNGGGDPNYAQNVLRYLTPPGQSRGGSQVAAAQPQQRQTRNPTIQAAAERGIPLSDRPLLGGQTVSLPEGQMPMARQMPPDLSNSPDGGARDFLLRQAGMAPDMQPSGPQGGPGFIERVVGGLGGLGGMRIPQGGGGGQPAPSAQPQGQPDIESLIPAAPRDPFAIIGPGAAQNQQWEAERQGKVAIAQMLVAKGMDPRQAAAIAQSPQALQLYQQDKQQTESRAFEREKFDFVRKDKEADNKRADDAGMSAPRKILRDLGIEPGHPEYKDQYKRLAGLGPAGASAEVTQRKMDAEALGLKPDNPGYQSYVLTGKMPREDAQPLSATDKKAILEADEGVMASESAIKALADAKKISPRALGGIGAGTRAMLGNALPDAMIPDALASKDASLATAELDNIVSTNALSQLKSIFGAAPTEGERKILMDIQGSVSQPDNVRQAIYDRAIMMAEKRLQFNRQRANELRGGAYYKPGDKQAAPSSGAPAAPAPPPQAGQPQPAEGLKPGVYEFVPGKGLIAK